MANSQELNKSQLDKEEILRLSIHDVTEASRDNLFKSVKILIFYFGLLISILSFAAYETMKDVIDDRVKNIVGTPENPTKFVKKLIKEKIDHKLKLSASNTKTSIYDEIDRSFKSSAIVMDKKLFNLESKINDRIEEAVKSLNEITEKKLNNKLENLKKETQYGVKNDK